MSPKERRVAKRCSVFLWLPHRDARKCVDVQWMYCKHTKVQQRTGGAAAGISGGVHCVFCHEDTYVNEKKIEISKKGTLLILSL